jgi:hypothetical protein
MDLPKRLKKGSSYGFRFKSDPLNNRHKGLKSLGIHNGVGLW